ncbi:MAG TPA: hypothetical protein VF173_03275 [Thermoanaerobaculia bacterium]|nr:hypothetical protein [Thermoanaerobaculia bacterium]
MSLDDVADAFQDQVFFGSPFIASQTFKIRLQILGEVHDGLSHMLIIPHQACSEDWGVQGGGRPIHADSASPM